jgi:hypothetical protein
MPLRPRVYIETTIPSTYYEQRTDPQTVARHLWTRRWWDDRRCLYDVVASVAVLEELERGDFPARDSCLSLLSDVPLLPTESGIGTVVQTYTDHHLMPANPAGDALHLALASHHKCDFLLTWNCKHLANANKLGHIRAVTVMLGLFVPSLMTPLELLGDSDDATTN